MDPGNSPGDLNIQAEKLSNILQTDFNTFSFNMQTFSIVLYTIHLMILISKWIKGDMRWNAWTVLMYALIALCSQTLFTLDYNSMAYVVTVCGLYLHWAYLPQQQVSAANKAILVTGCDRGIGHELAKKLDLQGYHVFAGCLCKGQEGEQDLVSACSDRLVTLQMDVKNREQVQQAALEVQNHLGNNKLWAIVNNAGICYIGNIEIMSIEDMEKVMAINYFGPVNVCREFLPLIRRSKGRLVNIASNAGLAPVPHMGVYCASKAALAIFSESLRYELDQWGVSVSTIVPSGYRTGILAYDKNAAAERWWNSASNTVKKDFGRDCFTPKFKHDDQSNTTPDLSSVVNTIVTALSVKHPHHFYYSGFLARTLPFVYLHLPLVLQDPVMKVLGHWFDFNPKALNNTEEKHSINGH